MYTCDAIYTKTFGISHDARSPLHLLESPELHDEHLVDVVILCQGNKKVSVKVVDQE